MVKFIYLEKFSPDRVVRKAPVPKDSGLIPTKTNKDFIKLNALENINSGKFSGKSLGL